MERIGLACWHRHAVLSERVGLLTQHVADRLLAWSWWLGRACVLAAEGDARRLLLNVSWMLLARALASRVLGLGTWSSSFRYGGSRLH